MRPSSPCWKGRGHHRRPAVSISCISYNSIIFPSKRRISPWRAGFGPPSRPQGKLRRTPLPRTPRVNRSNSAAWKVFIKRVSLDPQGVPCADTCHHGAVREGETHIQGKSSLRLVRIGALTTIVSGGLFVAIPLLYRGFELANSELAAEAIFDVGLYILVVAALFLVPMGMVGSCPAKVELRTHRALTEHSQGIQVCGRGSYRRSWWHRAWQVTCGGRTIRFCGWCPQWVPWGYTLGLVVGFILYRVATLQARILPPWCGIAFMAALPAAIALVWIRPLFGLGAGASTTSILFGLAWLGLGYNLWTRRRESR